MSDLDNSPESVAALKAIYATDSAAKAILDSFAVRLRKRRVTKVDNLQDQLGDKGLSRADVIRVLRKLEELGFGDFIEGRRGHPSRFEWHFDLVTVGKVAGGIVQQLQKVNEDDDAEEESEQAPVQPVGSIPHRFQLRPGCLVEIVLPADFTTREAARLSDFIKTLPFDEAQI